MSLGKAILSTFIVIFSIACIYRLVLGNMPDVVVTSWFRWPWKNNEVGGNMFSLHQIGWGFDLVPDGPVTMAQAIATGLPFLKFQSEGDHLHVQIF